MELRIKIENKNKLKKVRNFLIENSIDIVQDKTEFNGKKDNIKSLIEYLEQIKIDLPESYKFDREEANER